VIQEEPEKQTCGRQDVHV